MEKILESAVEIKSRNSVHELHVGLQLHVGLHLGTFAMLALATNNIDLGSLYGHPANKTPSAPLHQNSTENFDCMGYKLLDSLCYLSSKIMFITIDHAKFELALLLQ
jgi:hypothetical protein